jgi:hypothetical protein
VSTPLESRSVWSEIQSLLATESIPALAQRFHVRPGEIAEAIKRTGIQRKAVPSPASAAEEAAPTEAPAPATGAPAARKESKVAPYRHLLGVQTDGAIAKLAGVVAETVRMYRVRQGIAPAAQDQAAQNGSAKKSAASELPPEPQAPVRRGPGRPRKVQPAEAPAAAAAPARARKAAAKEPSATPARRGVPSPIDAHVHLLGRMTDADLAEQIGVTRGAVYQYRRHRKIPAFLPKVGKGEEAATPAPKGPSKAPKAAPPPGAAAEPTPAPAAEPVAAAPPVERAHVAPSAPASKKAPAARSAWAYTVTVRRGEVESTYAVLGKDLAEAASRAVSAVDDGEVVNITRYLESLS